MQKRVQWANGSKKNTIWEKTHERNARRVLNLMIELEGLWVKLGQYLSTRADVLPEAYISVLKQLQDSLPPRSLKEVPLSFLFSKNILFITYTPIVVFSSQSIQHFSCLHLSIFSSHLCYGQYCSQRFFSLLDLFLMNRYAEQ